METQVYYITKLKECLSQRQKANPSYSLRAYSKYLDIHSSTLSQILKGKRSLPLKRAVDVTQKLALCPKEKTFFMESFYRQKTNIDNIEINRLDRRYILDESYYKVIAEWEHYAVLELFNLDSLDVSIQGISRQLDINNNRAEVVLNNLINCGLITKDEDGSLKKTYPDVKTTEDIKNKALKESHIEALQVGATKLEEIEVELRDFSSTTVAVDLEKLSEAKTIIREFRQKMSSLLRDGKKTDVFQLAIQFYPLTNNFDKEKKQ